MAESPIHLDETEDNFLGRIPVRNIWHILLYAWELHAFQDRYDVLTEKAPSLAELFTKLLLQISHDMIRQGIHRAYVPTQETVKGVRGRILFTESLKRNSFHKQEAVCSFSHYHEDTLLNRILKATVTSLIQWGRSSGSIPKEDLHRLLDLNRYFSHVSDIRLYPGLFKQVVFHRYNRTYQMLIPLCEVIYKATMPTEVQGKASFRKVIKDELKGERLYEKFLSNFYALNLKTHEPVPNRLYWHEWPESSLMPTMNTDIALKSKDRLERIVIDAKWYQKTLTISHHGTERFNAGNLYQLYAYLRTQEEQSLAHREAKGILLYPKVTDDVDERFIIQGHPIKLATVDLTQSWQDIEARLLNIAMDWQMPARLIQSVS